MVSTLPATAISDNTGAESYWTISSSNAISDVEEFWVTANPAAMDLVPSPLIKYLRIGLRVVMTFGQFVYITSINGLKWNELHPILSEVISYMDTIASEA